MHSVVKKLAQLQHKDSPRAALRLESRGHDSTTTHLPLKARSFYDALPFRGLLFLLLNLFPARSVILQEYDE